MLDGFQQMVHRYRGCVISAPTVRPGETASPDIGKISTERVSESRGINYSKVVNDSIPISNSKLLELESLQIFRIFRSVTFVLWKNNFQFQFDKKIIRY